jgi:hypothetical protein
MLCQLKQEKPKEVIRWNLSHISTVSQIHSPVLKYDFTSQYRKNNDNIYKK